MNSNIRLLVVIVTIVLMVIIVKIVIVLKVRTALIEIRMTRMLRK